ncbi:Protein BTN1 [Colletotrichum trifolii]|uniref:Protein BTN n=1 Tax=Colletotrichum trifolii TaxID=5466 RepID=A0A4R8QNH8_COLTR|nr:Protein BTN1 [Colletotrichum trifolii]
MSVFASVSAAVTEVSCLGMIGHSGPQAVVGWGFGTGAGMLCNAVWPYVLTHRVGRLLRSATGGIYHLLAVFLLAHFLVLPQRLTKTELLHRQERGRGDEERRAFIECGRARSTSPRSGRAKFEVLRGLIRSELLPMFVASALLFLQQRAVRTLDGPFFATFSRFAATHGVSLHLGTLVSRSSIRFYPGRNSNLVLAALGAVTTLVFVNAVLLVSTHFALLLSFTTGVLSGLVYINILARIVQEVRHESDGEFSLGVVTAGDARGVLVGGVQGAWLETLICGHLLSTRRWCHRSR